MITLLLHLHCLFPFFCSGHRQLAIENLALRQQLAVYKRTATRPWLRTTDRLFWVGLARVWTGWRQPLVIVTPDTVLRWQRCRFRAHWTRLSGRPIRGRPPVSRRQREQTQQALISQVTAVDRQTVEDHEHRRRATTCPGNGRSPSSSWLCSASGVCALSFAKTRPRGQTVDSSDLIRRRSRPHRSSPAPGCGHASWARTLLGTDRGTPRPE
jgi:hypothetical protein